MNKPPKTWSERAIEGASLALVISAVMSFFGFLLHHIVFWLMYARWPVARIRDLLEGEHVRPTGWAGLDLIFDWAASTPLILAVPAALFLLAHVLLQQK